MGFATDTVAGFLNGLGKVTQGNLARQVLNGDSFRGQIDGHGDNPGHFRQAFFNMGYTGGAHHAADIERLFLQGDSITGLFDGSNEVPPRHLIGIVLDRCFLAGKINVGAGNSGNIGEPLFHRYRA